MVDLRDVTHLTQTLYFSHRQKVSGAADCIFAAGIEPLVAVMIEHELCHINYQR